MFLFLFMFSHEVQFLNDIREARPDVFPMTYDTSRQTDNFGNYVFTFKATVTLNMGMAPGQVVTYLSPESSRAAAMRGRLPQQIQNIQHDIRESERRVREMQEHIDKETTKQKQKMEELEFMNAAMEKQQEHQRQQMRSIAPLSSCYTSSTVGSFFATPSSQVGTQVPIQVVSQSASPAVGGASSSSPYQYPAPQVAVQPQVVTPHCAQVACRVVPQPYTQVACQVVAQPFTQVGARVAAQVATLAAPPDARVAASVEQHTQQAPIRPVSLFCPIPRIEKASASCLMLALLHLSLCVCS